MARKFETLVELLENSKQDFAEREIFGTKQSDGSWTWIHYRDFGKMVDQARAGLAGLGIEKGDRVAIVSDNRVEWAVFAFATYGLGACYVPMYEAQKAEEWEFILRDSGAKVVVAATGLIFDKLSPLTDTIESLKHVVGLALTASEDRSYQALLTRGAAAPVPLAPVTPDDMAGFIYTSGTTGNPKGVKLTHRNISTNIQSSATRFDITSEDRSLAFLPWAHAFGLVAELGTFTYLGASIAINDQVPELINNLPVVRPTILVAVPRIFNRIYDGVNKQMAEKPGIIRKLFSAGIASSKKKAAGESLGFLSSLGLTLADKLIFAKVRLKFGGKLRFVVSGSAALSPKVAEFIDALGIDVYEGYGLTETSPVVSVNFAGNRKIGSIGKPIPGVEVRIDTQVTGDPKNGEIIVSGPNVMQGYHNHPEEDEKVFCEDGAFRTGDMGCLDEDGFLYITGRIKEQYKLENGKYVVPSPLEEEFKLSPLILNVMLHGANHPHNVALVVPDIPALTKRAQAEGISLDDLENNQQVKALLLSEFKEFGTSCKSYEMPKDLVVAKEDFSTENGMLTPSLKVKRRNVLAVYGDRLEGLFL